MPVNPRVIAAASAAALLVSPAFAASPKADIENGKTMFSIQCGTCHSVEKSGPSLMGPNLVGIVGRKPAQVSDFVLYTAALKEHKVTWNAKTLDAFLASPSAAVPGTSMTTNISDEKIRADVIAYLETVK